MHQKRYCKLCSKVLLCSPSTSQSCRSCRPTMTHVLGVWDGWNHVLYMLPAVWTVPLHLCHHDISVETLPNLYSSSCQWSCLSNILKHPTSRDLYANAFVLQSRQCPYQPIAVFPRGSHWCHEAGWSLRLFLIIGIRITIWWGSWTVIDIQ